MAKIKITFSELAESVFGRKRDFPKYATSIINSANNYAQGTRPRVVGKLTELIDDSGTVDYEGWREWYLLTHPKEIDAATDRTYGMIQNYKKLIGEIDRKMVREWVEDLVIDKTYVGLRTQKAILTHVAKMRGVKYVKATPEEESRGIDGYLGNMPVSVKPITYRQMSSLSEEIPVKVIYYEKKKGYVNVDLSELGM